MYLAIHRPKKLYTWAGMLTPKKSLFDQNRTVDRSRLMNRLDLIEDEIQKQVLGTLVEMFAE